MVWMLLLSILSADAVEPQSPARTMYAVVSSNLDEVPAEERVRAASKISDVWVQAAKWVEDGTLQEDVIALECRRRIEPIIRPRRQDWTIFFCNINDTLESLVDHGGLKGKRQWAAVLRGMAAAMTDRPSFTGM